MIEALGQAERALQKQRVIRAHHVVREQGRDLPDGRLGIDGDRRRQPLLPLAGGDAGTRPHPSLKRQREFPVGGAHFRNGFFQSIHVCLSFCMTIHASARFVKAVPTAPP